jgi:hypothetical protein
MNRGSEHLTARARAALQRAEQEARALEHSFVGTEHVLLGIVGGDFDPAAVTLRKLGVDAGAVRAEIEKLVQRGAEPVDAARLPLTPRAQEAIRLAADEAQIVAHAEVDSEHLLLGLSRESAGVAAIVLRNLGLPLEKLRHALLRTRFRQMQIVERAVRPVRAGTPRKRKMREELLAHLTAIYHEALDHERDPDAALREAAERFGDPSALGRELDAAVTRSDRRDYYLEQWFGWRAPETAARWVTRLAMYFLLFLIALCSGGLFAAAFFAGGFDFLMWSELRGVIAFVVLLPISFAGCGLLYFEIRDSLLGMFGSRKSSWRVFLLQLLMAIFVTACGIAFVAVAKWDLGRGIQSTFSYVVGLAAALATRIAARFSGPQEYRDALWACMDLGETASGDSPEPA